MELLIWFIVFGLLALFVFELRSGNRRDLSKQPDAYKILDEIRRRNLERGCTCYTKQPAVACPVHNRS